MLPSSSLIYEWFDIMATIDIFILRVSQNIVNILFHAVRILYFLKQTNLIIRRNSSAIISTVKIN